MDKPKTYNEWHSSLQDFDALRYANCCRIAYEAGQQSRQAEIDEKDKRIQKATAKWISIVSILTTTDTDVPSVIMKQLGELHDALCGMDEMRGERE